MYVVSGKAGAVPVDEVVSGGVRSCCEPLQSTRLLLVTGACTQDRVIGLRGRDGLHS